MASIYDQIGGTAAVAATVDGLYGHVLGDPQLAPYFEEIDIARQKHHMRAFLTMALGGGDDYRGRDMATAHRGMGITDGDFDRVVGHLAATLAQIGVPAGRSDAILARIVPLRTDIVAR